METPVNPLVRASLANAEVFELLPEHLHQEWGEALAELAIWGAMVNEDSARLYRSQAMFTAAQERHRLLSGRLHSE